MLCEYRVMIFQVHRIGCVWKTPFRKSGHLMQSLLIHQTSLILNSILCFVILISLLTIWCFDNWMFYMISILCMLAVQCKYYSSSYFVSVQNTSITEGLNMMWTTFLVVCTGVVMTKKQQYGPCRLHIHSSTRCKSLAWVKWKAGSRLCQRYSY